MRIVKPLVLCDQEITLKGLVTRHLNIIQTVFIALTAACSNPTANDKPNLSADTSKIELGSQKTASDSTDHTLTKVAGQNFKFSYSDYGLGSNSGDPSSLIVTIVDTTLTYLIFERTSEYKIDPVFNDTLWSNKRVAYNVPFRVSSQDSILLLLKGKEGKYIYGSNPHVMSGIIQRLYFECKDWCVEFSLKNTFDSTAMHIVNIINEYLPKDNQIYIPFDLWTDREAAPLVKSCPSDSNKNYSDLLGDEYDLIRQKKK